MPTLSILLRKAKSFSRLSLWVQVGFIPCWLLLGVSKLAIFALSFKRLAPVFGGAQGVNAWVPVVNTKQRHSALMISRLIAVTSRYTPWNSNCFPQAVVARLLLGLFKVPYALFFGLSHDANSLEMKAHAWVAAGQVRVSGGYSFSRFTVVGCYVSPAMLSTAED